MDTTRQSIQFSHTMDFAPYQDESPEVERTFSPPPNNDLRSPLGSSPVTGQSPSNFAGEGHVHTSGHGNTGFGSDLEDGRRNLTAFDTSLPIRMDFEAMLAYLLLPPAGGVFLLLVEHKSDYVRYVTEIGGVIRHGNTRLLISLQIPCLAIGHALYCDLCRLLRAPKYLGSSLMRSLGPTPDPVILELSLVAPVYDRHCFYCVSESARLS